ncbi:hypothetical protein CTEN210_11951 [Chaetoceros tenuissimus]|uniref:Uncharacterized protein n=1 Tax=Chaetoceros tenuissimus TaxID=426638 RepID=A0AAD3H9L3_9STRA|nr:hypothetical protein CTEN210_11951 [Chaetoceros tenuissimus]
MKNNKKKTSIKAKSPVHISRNGRVSDDYQQQLDDHLNMAGVHQQQQQQSNTHNTHTTNTTNMNRERMDTDQTSNVSSSHTNVSSMAYQFAVQEYRNTIPSGQEEEVSSHYSTSKNRGNTHVQSSYQQEEPVINPSSSTIDDYESDDASHDPYKIKSTSTSYSFPNYPGSPSNYLHQRKAAQNTQNQDPSNIIISEPEMVDATYKEHYGDSYINAPVRYIYPQGYGSMRPRSRPWQISLVMVTTLAWLNVFIVGHCADRYEKQYQENQGYNVGDDDLAVQIETRWCGSRNLYFIWVLSVAVTAMSFAYCSCIGYVKARDFAVANGRSQPPGMVGKSDYYVELGFGTQGYNNKKKDSDGKKDDSDDDDDMDDLMYGGKNSIYQADGTPKYYGNQITKPTQAAVNMTSR